MQRLQEFSTVDQTRLLANMLHTEPVVRGCISRISNIALANDFTIMERFQPISRDLYSSLFRHYMKFLRDAVRSVWMCGFCAFVIVRIDNVPVPKMLPLGSFTWTVTPNTTLRGRAADTNATQADSATYSGVGKKVSQVKPKNRGEDLYWYDITLLTTTVQLEDVIIVNHVTPQSGMPRVIASPMANILCEYIRMHDGEDLMAKAVQWNTSKHLVVSESVNLQDQTTSGISLLSEFRNFLLSGQDTQSSGFIRLRSRKTGKTLDSYNDGVYAWLHSEFDEDKNNANVHVLPPNHTCQELQVIPLSELGVLNNRERFSHSVYEFFGMDISQKQSSAAPGNGQTTSTEVESMSRHQHAEATALAAFLELLLERAYAESFNVPTQDVKVRIRPQARLGISSTDDVKKLRESEFLNPAHGKKVRQMFGISKDMDELSERSASAKKQKTSS